MILKEIMEGEKPTIIVDKTSPDKDTMLIMAPWVRTGVRNKNGRIYSSALIKREIARVQKSIDAGSFLGSGDHGDTGLTTIKDVSHIIQKLELRDDGIGMATLKILPTERGKTIQTLIKNNARLGLSSRGFGNISKSGEVMNDYRLMGLDVVVSPSEPAATFSKDNVFESLSFEEEEDKKADLREECDNLLSDSYTAAVNDGMWYGDFASYKAKFGKPMKEVLGLENDEKIKLSEEQKERRIFSAYRETISGGFIGTFKEWKEKYPNVIELVTKPKIKTTEEESSSEGQKLISAYQESIEAGFRGSFEEWKEKNPKVIEVINRRPLTKEEFAQIEAKRCNVKVETVLRKWEIDAEKKIEENIRKRAIRNVCNDLLISGITVSKEKRDELIELELKGLIEEQKRIRRKG